MITLKYYLYCLFLVCSSTVTASDERHTVENEILSLASDLTCSTNENCKTIGMGDKSCGSFTRYIIYSTLVVNSEEMKRLADKHVKLDEQYNRENFMGSTCEVVMPRVSACIKKQCIDLGDQSNQTTPIHWAVLEEDIELIEELFYKGEDINASVSPNIGSPLQFAIRNKSHLTVIQTLLKIGADVNFSTTPIEFSTFTALHLAVSSQRPAVIKLLLDHGANVNSGGKHTPYSYAIDSLKSLPEYQELLERLKPDNQSK